MIRVFIITILLMLGNMAFASGPAADKNPIDYCAMISTLETYVEGAFSNDNSFQIYFNMTNEAFAEFLQNNPMESLKVELYKGDGSSTELELVNEDLITDIPGFQIFGWTLEAQNVEYDDDFYVSIYIDDVACAERYPVPLRAIDELTFPECSDNPDLSITSDELIDRVVPGDIITIHGFPLLLKTIIESGGTYSGTGIIPLPFSKQSIKVDIDTISVNIDKQVINGSVTAMIDNPADYPDFSEYENLNFGGEICLPPPPIPGYDENGINQETGLDDFEFNHETNTFGNTDNYVDENGFDINGNYNPDNVHPDSLVVNDSGTGIGTVYNDQGCSRNETDANGNMCNPSGGANPKAETYAVENEDRITTQINQIIDNFISSIETDIVNLNSECTGYRTTMQSVLDARPGLDRELIFGADDLFFKKEMHMFFEKEPTNLPDNIVSGRDPEIIKLEKAHVKLYHCDKTLIEQEKNFESVVALKEEMARTKFIAQILNDIASWTEYQFNTLSESETEFLEWLQSQTEKYLEDPTLLPAEEEFNSSESSINNKIELEEHMKKELGEAFSFQPTFKGLKRRIVSKKITSKEFYQKYNASLKNGNDLIDGVDRVYYTKQLSEKKNKSLNEDVHSLLPIKISNAIAGINYDIFIESITINANGGGTLNASMLIVDGNTGEGLVFRADNIPFGAGGFGAEDATLSLASTVEVRLNNASMLFINTDSTSITWDCNGFKHMDISASVEFCRNYILPIDENDKVIEPTVDDPARYKFDIGVKKISAWNEFEFKVDAEPFALAKYEDIIWEVNNMCLDFSSTTTPVFTPLEGYQSVYWDEETKTMDKLWKGFYLESLSAKISTNIGDEDLGTSSDEKVEIIVHDVLIDDNGFTGGAGIKKDLVSLDNGSLGGWAFSIDTFEIRVISNQFAGTGFGGQTRVPIFEEAMDYVATVYPNDKYAFTVFPAENYSADVFLAEVQLKNNSSISLQKDSQGFVAKAKLNGSMSIKSNEQGVELNTPSLIFQGMEISSRAPHFSPGVWGFDGGSPDVMAGYKGFELSISGVKASSEESGLAGIDFKADIGLVAKDKLDLHAGGSFTVLGELGEDDMGRQKWKYADFKINRFFIDAEIGEVAHIAGELEWFENKGEWGDGFRGIIDADFPKFGNGTSITAYGHFGRVSEERYFFVDVVTDLPFDIPAGPIQFTGFSGGVYYHMGLDGTNISIRKENRGALLPPFGGSLSGGKYNFNKEVGLGLLASAYFKLANETLLNGSVGLEIATKAEGGIEEIAIRGSAQILAEIDQAIKVEYPEKLKDYTDKVAAAKDEVEGMGGDTGSEETSEDTVEKDGKIDDLALMKPESVNAPISAYITLKYNFTRAALDGSLYGFLEVPGISGAGVNNSVTTTKLHFSKDDWYIWMGTPKSPMGLEFKIPVINTKGRVNAYMDVGTNVPAMEPLDPKYSEIAYKVNDNASLRKSGAGIVFGAAVNISAEVAVAKIFKASMEAEAGFDVMLRKYNDVSCSNTGEPIGINGWYAAGQLYALLKGDLEVFGAQIFSLGLAAIIQAQLPNPFYGQAAIGVQLSLGLLGTLKKSMSISLGEPCDLISNDPDDELGIEIISNITPDSTAANVDALVQPEVFLNIPLNENYSLTSLGGESNNFLVSYKNASLISESGISIPVQYTTEDDGYKLVIHPRFELPVDDPLTFSIEVQVYKNGEKLTTEIKEETFTVSSTLETIPAANVESAYPYDGMVNYHKGIPNDYRGNPNAGYIELAIGQPSLFTDGESASEQYILLSQSTGYEKRIDLEYSALENRINYILPKEDLDADGIYKLRVVNENIKSGELGILYELFFRVSKFSDPVEKLSELQTQGQAESFPYAGTVKPYNLGAAENINISELDNGHYTFSFRNIKLEKEVNKDLDIFADALQSDVLITDITDQSFEYNPVELKAPRGGWITINSNTYLQGNMTLDANQSINLSIEQVLDALYEQNHKAFEAYLRRNIDVVPDNNGPVCTLGNRSGCPKLPVFDSLKKGTYELLVNYKHKQGAISYTSNLNFTTDK